MIRYRAMPMRVEQWLGIWLHLTGEPGRTVRRGGVALDTVWGMSDYGHVMIGIDRSTGRRDIVAGMNVRLRFVLRR